MGILCGDRHPFPNPPLTQFFRGKNTHCDKVQQIGLRDERGIVTIEQKLVVRVNGRNDDCQAPYFFLLGAMELLTSTESSAKSQR